MLHSRFEKILSYFTLGGDQMEQLLIDQFKDVYRKLNAEKIDFASLLRTRIAEVQGKLDRLEERFVLEEISGEQYAKFQAKLKEEKGGIEQELQKAGQQVSNLDLAVKNLFQYARNLSVYWGSAGYYEKVQAQYWMFPIGISYSKKDAKCRTKEIDCAMLYIALLTQDLAQKKIGIPELNIKYPDLVQWYGTLSNQLSGSLCNYEQMKTSKDKIEQFRKD